MQVLIAYHSDYMHTQAVADAIVAGAKAALADADEVANVVLKQTVDVGLDDMCAADVLIFGSPVHMGSMAWQMKQLIDSGSKLWMAGELEGKIGGVFATYGGYGGAGGGVEQTLIALHANFLEHGMLVCGFPRSLSGYAYAGLHWGLAVRTGNEEGMPEGIDEAALLAARAYGSHVMETALRLK
ncbi:flavodoxin family protein [Ghiorsea bivora]|uniref:flavodoxin family protein n=1 Tax=Ghiorsea bivora TaxID=1485545 RepID=UPI000570A8D9|nr:NAD(P)H-dependent oxidoreductase [Ghiorsea bivora]